VGFGAEKKKVFLSPVINIIKIKMIALLDKIPAMY